MTSMPPAIPMAADPDTLVRWEGPLAPARR